MALELAASDLGVGLCYDWLHTTTLDSNPQAALRNYQGIWCVPASPYANTAGAIGAIRFAREHDRAFLGTCGGFQHALMEFAQNVLGLPNPRHAELDPEATDPLIGLLTCSLVETSGTIILAPESRIARAYGVTEIGMLKARSAPLSWISILFMLPRCFNTSERRSSKNSRH